MVERPERTVAAVRVTVSQMGADRRRPIYPWGQTQPGTSAGFGAAMPWWIDVAVVEMVIVG